MKEGALWLRFDRFGRNLLPLALTLCLMLFSAVPVPIPGYAMVVPLFPLCAVYFWAINRPQALPPPVAPGARVAALPVELHAPAGADVIAGHEDLSAELPQRPLRIGVVLGEVVPAARAHAGDLSTTRAWWRTFTGPPAHEERTQDEVSRGPIAGRPSNPARLARRRVCLARRGGSGALI